MSNQELVEAVQTLAQGDLTTDAKWEACHDLCQAHEGETEFDWVHGLVHLIEGDIGNAGYWYRRAGKAQLHDDIKLECQHIAQQLSKT